MFTKKETGGFALMAVVVVLRNIVFWLALAAGVLYLLRAFEVI